MRNELVIVNNGKATTTSLLVAETFGKQHKNVMTAIREIMTAQNSAVLSMFCEAIYYNEQNKPQPMYVMDRDGFSLLVMGFTGKQALRFKLDFIDAFNKMEQQVRKPMSQLDILMQSVVVLQEQERKISVIENKVERIEAQIKLRPDYFTIVGYGTLHNVSCGLKLASSLGRKAAQICKNRGIEMENIPDPRFGKVRTYPEAILYEVFEQSM